MRPRLTRQLSWLRPPGHREGRVFYWILLALAAALAFYLCRGTNPWDEKLLRSIAKREAEGKLWKIEHYAVYYSWWAALINFVGCIALLLTIRLWSTPLPVPIEGAAAGASAGRRRLFAIGLCAAVILGGVFRVQRLDHSFWSDEEYAFRTHIWGQMIEDEGGLELQQVPWRDTFFRNKANNHIGFTVPTKALYSVFVSDDRPVNEALARAVPFVLGLASIGLVGALVEGEAGLLAGLVVAFFWALNPWHLRYSVEARGYSQMLFFMLLAFFFLIRALRDSRWRNWIGFALAELLLLISYPGAFHVLVVANLMALAILLYGKSGSGDRRLSIMRLCVVNLLAGMAFIQLFLPSVPQMEYHLTEGTMSGSTGLELFEGVWVHFSSGLQIRNDYPAEHLGSSFLSESERSIYFRVFHVPVMLALLGLGMLAAAGRHRWLLIPGFATLLGGVATFVHSRITGSVLWPGYVVFEIIGLSIFVVLGMILAASAISRLIGYKPAVVRAAVAFVLLGIYAIESTRARSDYCTKPIQPIRQIVKAARGESPAYSSEDGGIITGSFGPSRGMITTYDPRVHLVKSAGQLKDLIEESKSSGKRLLIYVCGQHVAESRAPDVLAIVRDPASFTEVVDARKPALSELFSYHLYEWTGGATGE